MKHYLTLKLTIITPINNLHDRELLTPHRLTKKGWTSCLKYSTDYFLTLVVLSALYSSALSSPGFITFVLLSADKKIVA